MVSTPRSFAERVRRNHALEHATLHVLARNLPDLNLVGRSDWQGFMIYGEIDTETLRQAAEEGWERLQAGQRELSIHPRCGTNLAVTGLLVGAAMLVGFLGSERARWRRLPLTLMSLAGAFTLAAPLGPIVQKRMTTDPDMEGVSIGRVIRLHSGRWAVHRVEIEHEV